MTDECDNDPCMICDAEPDLPSKPTGLRAAWQRVWRARADAIRADWDEYVARWERDTEPGYPLPASARHRRGMALSLADMCDAIGGGSR